MATLVSVAVAGCARANSGAQDPAPDAAEPDARAADAPPAVVPDASVDTTPGCAISANAAPVLDGIGDLEDYAMAQRLAPGAMLGSDGVAVTWDATTLYITVASIAFEGEYEPLHVYLQTGTTLTAATPAMGKEYSGLVPVLPFAPTHLIAVRRTTGVDPYDGVYLPGAGWATREIALDPGTHVFVAADHHALSVSVPWTAIGGCPTTLRLALHVVHAQSANEWKDLVPASHTPWLAPGGGYYELDLTGSPGVASWTLLP